ncbi:hypothetical protein [Lacrimispora sp. JR3]|uniref:hypothetical protein n=1 Tax=Lacrimispora sinapis TaxID=3111456 RepID=UPI003747B61F
MKKSVFNVIYYLICFFIICGSIYRLAFTIPPQPGTPGYNEYLFSTLVMGVGIGLLVILPNIVIDCQPGGWFS